MKYIIITNIRNNMSNSEMIFEVDTWSNYGDHQVLFEYQGEDYYLPWTSIKYIKGL